MSELRLPELRAGRFWRVERAVDKEGMVVVSLMQEYRDRRGNLRAETLRNAYAEGSVEQVEMVAGALRAAQDTVDQVNAVVDALVGDYWPEEMED